MQLDVDDDLENGDLDEKLTKPTLDDSASEELTADLVEKDSKQPKASDEVDLLQEIKKLRQEIIFLSKTKPEKSTTKSINPLSVISEKVSNVGSQAGEGILDVWTTLTNFAKFLQT